MHKVTTILGTRPEITKLSPVLPRFDDIFDHRVIHTGQHYDYEMDGVFFEQLRLRPPEVSLAAGRRGLSHGRQTAEMMIGIEEILLDDRPDAVVVFADPNTPLAGALVASKIAIPLVHMEAGCRSGNRRMPEEINRILCDHCADLLLAPDDIARANLQREGIDESRVRVVGSTAIEASRRNFALTGSLSAHGFQDLDIRQYAVLTLHRAENTDDPGRLRAMLESIDQCAAEYPILLPLHPRTRQRMLVIGYRPRHIRVVPPQGYLEFLALLGNSSFVLTDSGGIQEEAAALSVPCLVLRNETEWRYLTDIRKNLLVGTQSRQIRSAIESVLGDSKVLENMRAVQLPGECPASTRIVKEVQEWLNTHV